MTRNRDILRAIRALHLAPVGATVRSFRQALAVVESAWPRLTRSERLLHSKMCAADMLLPDELYTGEPHQDRDAILAVAARFSEPQAKNGAYADLAITLREAQEAANAENESTYVVEVGNGYSWGFTLDQDAIEVCRPKA